MTLGCLFSTVKPDMEMTHVENHDPDDPVAIYIREVSNVESLTREEEGKAISKTGPVGRLGRTEEKCRDEIDRESAHVGREHRTKALSGWHSVLDLIQDGNMGLMNAVRSFSERPIGDFTAHAAACIEDAIAKALGKSK